MGWIEVIVGPMFSGKSEELIRRLRRAEIARQRLQIFKPSIDERYAANEIVSHSGLGIPSDNVFKAAEILEKRSEEHTSELQSPDHLVCRLLLEKKNGIKQMYLVMKDKDNQHSHKQLDPDKYYPTP